MDAAARRSAYLEALGIERWLPREAAAGSCAPGPAPAAVKPVAPPAPQAQVPAAITAAAMAPDWQALAERVRTCTQCGLHATRTQTVFGVGNMQAELVVIGEAPGADEDRQGEPFVGRAGQLLNSMLRAMGQPRQVVYIANVLKCRPPGNRDPAPAEVACCLPFLHAQLELLKPRLLLAVGRIAAQNLLATDTPIGKLRGHVHAFGPRATPLVVTYHPAYLLRSPTEKRRAWQDLAFARRELVRLRAAARPSG